MYKKYLINSFGPILKKRIVVIESDDWGSSRMRSKRDRDELIAKNFKIRNCAYNNFDRFESNKDVEGLLDVLTSVRDANGNPAKFTINNIVANPDYGKIADAKFTEYHYESFLETKKRYKNSDKINQVYTQGVEGNVFKPQFHGREHVNINTWMAALQANEGWPREIFEREMFTVYKSGNNSGRSSFLNAFGSGDITDLDHYAMIIKTGLNLFREIWKTNSLTFIAPTYEWPTFLEPILHSEGIRFLQGTHIQRRPSPDGLRFSKKWNFLGKKSVNEQTYLTRNAFFEPTSATNYDAVDRCLKEVDIAFKMRKPAIICSHRVNYIGSIEPTNRDANLLGLKSLLTKILKAYPDVEFMFSDDLGKLISKE